MYLVITTTTTTTHPVKEGGSWQVALSGCTAAAQHGLYLSVTHKPFRAATASPELLAIETRLHLFTYSWSSATSRQKFSGSARHVFQVLCMRLTVAGGQDVHHLKQTKNR